jgi:hypothetical protein
LAAAQRGRDGRGSEGDLDLIHEVIGELHLARSPAALRFLTECLLALPCTSPEAAVERSLQPVLEQRIEALFPLLPPLLRALCASEPDALAAELHRQIGELMASGAAAALGKDYLLWLLAELQDPRLEATRSRDLLADSIAELVLELPDARHPAEGAALLVLARAGSATAGGWRLAAERFERCFLALEQTPLPAGLERRFFGEENALDGSHPRQALLAAPTLCRARVALAAGDRAAAARFAETSLTRAPDDQQTRTHPHRIRAQCR